MPYITRPERHDALISPAGSGELNYALTEVVNRYLSQRGLSYDTINDVVGALEGAKLEFYRRVAVPYENAKLTINGDVYDFSSPYPLDLAIRNSARLVEDPLRNTSGEPVANTAPSGGVQSIRGNS